VTPKPLAGIHVLDLTRLLPGNYCTWLLASLGASVLKIEDPGAGDYMRAFGVQVDGQGATHQLVNRGKRSAVISLKHEEGRGVFARLVERADVVVSSFRPGVLERLGLGYAELRRIRPSLVCAELTGFGRSGPLASVAAHDLNYLAFGGLLERLGPAGGPPVPPPVPLADLVGGGLIPALAIVALVLSARATGQGAHLDASLAEGIALLPHLAIADILGGVQVPGRGGSDFGGGLACYSVYEARDGYVSVGAVEERFWQVVCEELGLPELVDIQYNAERQGEIREALAAVFRTQTRAEIERRFVDKDACVVAVSSYEEMLVSDQAKERGFVRTLPQLPMRVLAPPFVIDGERPPEGLPAPRHGEHTLDVLRELGLGEEEIERLVAAGAAGAA
jgi:crotonobetainyl-CoA:carnitine CoA-transferase CaiB-like acyl-CoA transferase